ncbi:hypothetical protein FA13DRAFT_1721152 [Coprinellus micaceus]|uniref:Uncharacterized protein n=1 Tax=Coprinellus micaceus TaxID=71717 RepID=A0A4Y7S2K0_COPMI|nr:hypothetical protein FA13DRAFT_1721152 [Coprinellus micaceus]
MHRPMIAMSRQSRALAIFAKFSSAAYSFVTTRDDNISSPVSLMQAVPENPQMSSLIRGELIENGGIINSNGRASVVDEPVVAKVVVQSKFTRQGHPLLSFLYLGSAKKAADTLSVGASGSAIATTRHDDPSYQSAGTGPYSGSPPCGGLDSSFGTGLGLRGGGSEGGLGGLRGGGGQGQGQGYVVDDQTRDEYGNPVGHLRVLRNAGTRVERWALGEEWGSKTKKAGVVDQAMDVIESLV